MAENKTTDETTPETTPGAADEAADGAEATGAETAATEATEPTAATEAAEATDVSAGAATKTAPEGKSRRKVRVGTVTSDKSQKTVTVTVERQMAHPLYGKQVGRRKKVHAHDEKNEYRIGDIVRITETRPLSRTKRWRVVELIERPE